MEITTERLQGYRSAIATEGLALAALAPSAWDAAVPTCPGWDVGTLLVHTGGTHRWAAANMSGGERVRMSQMPRPPERRDEQLAWFRDGLDALLTTISTVDPEATVWTFAASGEQRAAWWMRRMAEETTIHRWDAASAAGPPDSLPGPMPAGLAADGIDEYLADFVPRLPAETFGGWKGTLHLHTTDAEGEWVLDLADVTAPVRREHAKADTAVRGPASDLLMWLYNRRPADTLEVHGDRDVVARWTQVCV